MSPSLSFSDALAEEVLTDAAGSFFGARKQLEDMIEVFWSFVETFRKKEVNLSAKAGFLNYLLLEEKAAPDFYKRINADFADILLEGKYSDTAILHYTPFAFTGKGEYIKFVLRAYKALQRACDEYMNGKIEIHPYNDGEHEDENEKLPDINYKFLVDLCRVVNDEIRRINSSASLSSVLQFVKKFNPEAMERERATGGTGGEYMSIDEKLSYRPIKFESLNLKRYPELPKEEQVVSDIVSFCKKNYTENKADIQKRISDLKKKIREYAFAFND